MPRSAAFSAGADAVAGAVTFLLARAALRLLGHVAISVPRVGPLIFAAAWVTALYVVDGYDVQIPASRVRSLVVVVKAAPIVGILATGVLFLAGSHSLLGLTLLSIAMGIAGLSITRWTAARLLLNRAFAKRAVVVGKGTASPELAETLEAARFDYRVVGLVGTTAPPINLHSPAPMASVEDLSELLRESGRS